MNKLQHILIHKQKINESTANNNDIKHKTMALFYVVRCNRDVSIVSIVEFMLDIGIISQKKKISIHFAHGKGLKTTTFTTAKHVTHSNVNKRFFL